MNKVKKELDKLKIPYEMFYSEIISINEKGIEKRIRKLDYIMIYGQKVGVELEGYTASAMGWGCTAKSLTEIIDFFNTKYGYAT